MLTKDFIKKVEELGLYVDKSEKFGHILVIDGDHRLVAYVKNNERSQFSTAFASFDNLLEPMQRKLIELIGMYARTLPDKREQEQKFYLKFKIKTNDDYYFLNFDKDDDCIENNDIVGTDVYETQFTQKEIDDIKKRFGLTLSDFEQIPIEEYKEWF